MNILCFAHEESEYTIKFLSHPIKRILLSQLFFVVELIPLFFNYLVNIQPLHYYTIVLIFLTAWICTKSLTK